VDTQTRHALKKDTFAQATATSVGWLSGHRSSVVRWAIVAVVVIALVVGGLIFWNVRTTAADTALGAALDTYGGTLAQPGQPLDAGIYATAADRSSMAGCPRARRHTTLPASPIRNWGRLPQLRLS
jgi:hypothetical protein